MQNAGPDKSQAGIKIAMRNFNNFRYSDDTTQGRKQRSFKKTSTSASLTTLKPLTVQISTNCGKFLKR